MMELSSGPKPVAMNMSQEEIIAEECRQRRAAEREGRRRRRQQTRKNAAGGGPSGARHADGMSSDDELSTTDSLSASKIRTDVENQARQVMSDVVDDFSTVDGKGSVLLPLSIKNCIALLR